MILIDISTSLNELQHYLETKKWLLSNEKIQNIEKPGEGNMNVVLRVITNQRSFILKQSRPYVQKFQQIEAPLDRITVEYEFYKAITGKQIDTHFPSILGYDAENYTLLMQDLGHCKDMSESYKSNILETGQLQKLTQILSVIHHTSVPNNYPKNRGLRVLNHQHIFMLPFMEDNGFALDVIQEGLKELSIPYTKDKNLKLAIHAIGEQYLADGDTLLHGDYYPGSWMTRENQVFVIDPEFSFLGFAEFDLGVMAGHCIMATKDFDSINRIAHYYESPFDKKLMTQMAGIEIMRRIIGIAQLPLALRISEKDQLLQQAKKMILI